MLFKFNFGVQRSSDFILRFYFDKTSASDEQYVNYIADHSDDSSLLHMEPSGDGKKLYMTYDISLKEDVVMNEFISLFASVDGVSEVVLISSKNDINY